MPKKTLSECVNADLSTCSIGGIHPQNREDWSFGTGNFCHLLPVLMSMIPTSLRSISRQDTK